MQIRVASLPENGIVIELNEPVNRFAVLKEMQEQGECEFLGNIAGVVAVKKVMDMVAVSGNLHIGVRLMCSRCLEEFDTILADHFSVSFTKNLPEIKEEQSEFALQAEDLGLVFYEGDIIDLHDAVQEQVVMLFPVSPVCASTCKGLCHTCGENLNKGGCTCEKNNGIDPRFAVLKALKLPPRKD
ncbi:MAG: DUF177 domain-containing protein [Desulfobacterales bacterium]|jgi:uncharacterized protein|nr:DUF177 domain-containing protein [Desulfobacterales bacterium]